jgi:hypothetical protein
MREEMRADKELLKEEMPTMLGIHHERMMAMVDSQLEKIETCLGNMETTDLEANPEK